MKFGGLGVVAVAGLLLSAPGRWGMMVHKAFKVSLSYLMRSSLRDNKKGVGRVCGKIRRPMGSEIKSCLPGLT